VLGTGPRILSVLALAGLLATAAYLGVSDRYVVYGAVVIGNQRVPTEVIRAAAGLDGKRLFRIERTAAAARVAALPEIRTATVEARLPHDVWIRVEETQPVLAWVSAGTAAALGAPATTLVLDERGRVVAGASPAGLPVVIDEAGLVAGIGDEVPSTIFAAALTYVARFPVLRYRPAEGFVAEGRGGWDILLGTDASRADQQTELLSTLSDHLAPIDASVAMMDLRYERPYYRLHGFGSGRE
jgi:cell division protein FtsQ